MAIGVTVFAHGSTVESANEAVREVVRKLESLNDAPVVPSFLEGGKPSLPEAVGELIAKGCHKILVVPYFLTVGLHLKRDLPNLVEELKASHPLLEIMVTEPLDGHPALAQILQSRIEAGALEWR